MTKFFYKWSLDGHSCADPDWGGGGGGGGETGVLEHLRNWRIMLNCCDLSSALVFDWIFFIIAGSKDNHKSFDEFEFKVEPTSNWN